MKPEIKKSEFAALLGVSRGYISQLAKADRLVLSADGNLVVVQPSLELLANTASAEKAGVSARHALERWKGGGHGMTVQESAQALQSTGQDVAPAVAPPAPMPSAREVNPFVGVDMSNPMAAYNAARASNEIKRGHQIDIELAKARGALISHDVTVKLVADLAASTRAAFERIPDRIGIRIAAETDPHVVYALLEEAIDECCETLSKQTAELASKLTL